MAIVRVVSNISTDRIDDSREYYEELFGFRTAMDMGWIVTLVSPDTPAAQISLIRSKHAMQETSNLTLIVEVIYVDAVFEVAVSLKLDITYPLTDEAWGGFGGSMSRIQMVWSST